jgi:hypothetical protein
MNTSPESTTRTERQLPCRYLRCKEMFHGSPDDDAFASGGFWCTLTQEAFGPDGATCGKKECCDTRACYLS